MNRRDFVASLAKGAAALCAVTALGFPSDIAWLASTCY